GLLMLLTVAGVLVLFLVLNDDTPSNGNNTNNQGLTSSQNNNADELIEPPATVEPTATPEPTPTPPAFTDAVWIGVGDIMSHTPQLPGAYNKETDSYNFNSVFEPIAHIINQGDWKMANLETPMAGKDYGFTGYP